MIDVPRRGSETGPSSSKSTPALKGERQRRGIRDSDHPGEEATIPLVKHPELRKFQIRDSYRKMTAIVR